MSSFDNFIEKAKKKPTSALMWGGGYLLLLAFIGGNLGEFFVRHQLDEWGNPISTYNPFNIFHNLFQGFFRHFGITFILFVISLILLYIWIDRNRVDPNYDERGFYYSKNGTYGTAKPMTVATARRILKVKPVGEQDADILGKIPGTEDTVGIDPEASHDNEKHALGPHRMIIGPSGSGKSRSWAFNRIMQAIVRGESFLASDPKGELFSVMRKLLEKHGYYVKQFNLVNMKFSDAWDAFGAFLPDEEDFSRDFLVDVQNFCNIVVKNTREGKPDQFEASYTAYFLACALFVATVNPPERRTFGDIYEFMTKPLGDPTNQADTDPKTVSGSFNALRVTEPTNPSFGFWNSFLVTSPNLRGNLANAMTGRLQTLASQTVRSILSKDDEGIDLILPAKKKCAYFVIMSDQNSTFKFLSSLFFTAFFDRFVHYTDTYCPNKRSPIPIHVLLDEFVNIGEIPDFKQKLATIRSRGISVSMIIQGSTQLEDRFGAPAAAELIGNSDILLCLGANDLPTQKLVSERAGDATVVVHTSSKDRRAIGINYQNHFKESTADGKRRVYTPDEVGAMPNHQCLVLFKGERSLKLDKFDYSEHYLYPEIEESVVLDYIPSWRRRELKKQLKDGVITKRQYQDMLRPADYFQRLQLDKELKQLKTKFDKGIISNEEYEEEREKIYGELEFLEKKQQREDLNKAKAEHEKTVRENEQYDAEHNPTVSEEVTETKAETVAKEDSDGNVPVFAEVQPNPLYREPAEVEDDGISGGLDEEDEEIVFEEVETPEEDVFEEEEVDDPVPNLSDEEMEDLFT